MRYILIGLLSLIRQQSNTVNSHYAPTLLDKEFCQQRHWGYLVVNNTWPNPFNVFIQGQAMGMATAGGITTFKAINSGTYRVMCEQVDGYFLIASKRIFNVQIADCDNTTITIR